MTILHNNLKSQDYYTGKVRLYLSSTSFPLLGKNTLTKGGNVMKTLLKILLLMLLFSSLPPGLIAQTIRIEGENGWVLLWHPERGIDSSKTRDYFSYQGSQVFENFGETWEYNGYSYIHFPRFKDFPEFSAPDTLLLRARTIEWDGNLTHKSVTFNFQDSTGGFVGTSFFFDLEHNWKLMKLPVKEIFERSGVEEMQIVRIYMVFVLISSDPLPSKVEMIVETDYLSLIYGEEEIIIDDFDDVTSVQDEAVITNYTLEQNYPNPFNPTTKIKYQLPQESYVTIKLYDILGRELKVLTATQHDAGIHELKFDGSDLPSGTYIYRITAGSFTESKKMLLVK